MRRCPRRIGWSRLPRRTHTRGQRLWDTPFGISHWVQVKLKMFNQYVYVDYFNFLGENVLQDPNRIGCWAQCQTCEKECFRIN